METNERCNLASKLRSMKIRREVYEQPDIITRLIGNNKKWQIKLTIFLALFQIPNTLYIVSSYFQGAKKEFLCKRPRNLSNLPVDTWRTISKSMDNCHQAKVNWTVYTVDDLLTIADITYGDKEIIPCSEWSYKEDNLGKTWISEWNLVCGRKYITKLAEVLFLMGIAAGGIVGGFLSDEYGRHLLLSVAVVLQIILSLSLCIYNDLSTYLVVRALIGFYTAAAKYAALILAMELVEGKWRTIVGLYNFVLIPISSSLMSGIAYLTQDFRKLQIAITIPGICLVFLLLTIPESPRWLLVKEQKRRLTKLIEQAAKINGLDLPENFNATLICPEDIKANFSDLYLTKYLRNLTICFVLIWFTLNFVHYGLLVMNNNENGKYMYLAMGGLEAIGIAVVICIINIIGRKWLFFLIITSVAATCLCAAILEGIDKFHWLKILFLMAGKYIVSAGNMSIPVYTAELYPLAIRNTSVGICNAFGALALIIVGYLSYQIKINKLSLVVIFSILSFVGAIVTVFLPQTKRNLEEQ